MCGIAGIISKDKKFLSLIDEVTDLVQHRGPDGRGIYLADNVAFGHRRLAIIDLTDHGKQPMHYQERYVITYNGEVYNYLELREELAGKGHRFSSHSDTEVILAAYAEWGTACLSRLNGMFSFAIHDRDKEEVFCARDRFGVKPFYYYEQAGVFAFASEIKQFTLIPDWKARLNHNKIVDYLVHDIIDRDHETFFQNVYQLRGGHSLRYSLKNNTFTIKKWYELASVPEYQQLSETEAVKKFRTLFSDAIKLRLRSDVKVGSCLSGGVDSSSIVSVVNQLLSSEKKESAQEAVSACFPYKKYDEQQFIDELISEKKISIHKVFPEINALFPTLDKIIWHQDEPFGSTSIFAQWNVFSEAKKNNLIVMLDGQGADEILGGYHTYYAPYILSAINKKQWRNALRRFREVKRSGYSSSWIIKELLKNKMPSSLKVKFQNLTSKRFSHVNRDLLSEYQHSFAYPDFKYMSHKQIFETNLPMLLHYEDRDSMAFSVESRVPFLDYRVVEFCYSMDESILIKNGTTKYVLREAMKELLPEKIYARKDKMGFITPELIWMKENKAVFENELRDAVKALNPIVNESILELFDRMLNGSTGFDFTPWKVIALGRWMKVFNVSIQ